MGKKYFYITTPMYYVNDVPHIGHIYSTLICDVIARFKRLDGYNVKFITGTDEHGYKIQKAAAKNNFLVKNFVDNNSAVFKKISDVMSCNYDDFIRTTENRHKNAVYGLWQRLCDYNQIYLGHYSGWYSVRDEAFYQAQELVDNRAPTGAEVEWVEESSYFFKLSEWQDALLDFYSKNPNFITPRHRLNEVISFVKSGLKDLSISRYGLSWGIKVPNDDKHVIYVWVDALSSYLTALGFPDTSNREYQQYWDNDHSLSIHVIGKDILKFHAVYWPAILMAAKLPLPSKILAHGWWVNEGQKISKSIGNVIEPFKLIEEFGIDQMRYFLIKEIPIGNDGNFSRQSVINCINYELVNNIGNLVHRTISLIHRECNGLIPEVDMSLLSDKESLPDYYCILHQVSDYIMHYELYEAVKFIVQISSSANEYITERAPWHLCKIDKKVMEAVLYKLVEYIRCIGMLLQPIMPNVASKILDQIAVPINKRCFSFFAVKSCMGSKLLDPQPIFTKYELY
ncbi:methionine--tRNA ligase [Neoehrlichia mikurensis]|uniref:Methionine--tRNA ligase n=1 Tax=Neoehrlichia mikurensis TaxID=89586 RepID=A0A9Q9BT89_9RICK|nr:methionine--tRNA ligase [Neoehrlichia mikurensis]QXK92395.1 methionine--tRNA ligase [Neoehrlichia mikurensis]QXK93242.1 methionine--tRNA ligase [Neoehrlichia mikurensis]QXK94086.1 methionine--tRNA ligase [Neoehrlichia mikurensis]UTO55692.1 methionine--tRNA ligase [Neoehrlichia mikurensis]UTO56836.1 methionine--tRNA ligase [Neoehrlichia mikurensis]